MLEPPQTLKHTRLLKGTVGLMYVVNLQVANVILKRVLAPNELQWGQQPALHAINMK